MKSRARSSADPRLVAAQVLREVLRGRSLNDCLPAGVDRLAAADRSLASELAQGACRWYPQLDFILGRLLERPLRRRDLDVHALLAIGLYQLRHTRIPPHAAVAETVAAARGLGKDWARGLVNGILRRSQREAEAVERALEGDPAARLSLPRWLLARLERDWPEHWRAIAAALLERPPMTLRVNRSQLTRAEAEAMLTDAGLASTPVAGVASALRLEHPVPVTEIPGFDRGLVSVQDAGAQLAAPWLDLAPGQHVLDVCAAPGGKTGHVLEHCPGIAVTAVDVSAARLERVRENLARLGLDADLHVDDAGRPTRPWSRREYDRILVDAPCSATGVMRRHPDVRLLRRDDDIAALAERQQAILDTVWPLLRPGGKLLYVTCSVLSQENESRVEAFMSTQSTAVSVPLADGPGSIRGPGRQLLPGDCGDGFFYALLEKRR